MASIPDPPGHGGALAGPESGGGYEVGAAIRQGWGGTIHEGSYRPSGRRVTLQEIRPDLAATPALIDRLGEIGGRAATLRDPHLLAVYDLVDDGGVFRLIAEWSGAPTLAAILLQGSLPAEKAVAVVDGVLGGLVALHTHRLFHGQVAPETVVVDADGNARLAELAVCAAAARPGFGPQTDVRDAARLGLHLLRGAGARLDAVRRPLEAAAADGGIAEAARLREDVAGAVASVLGTSGRDAGQAPPLPPPPVKRARRRRRLALAVLAALAVAGAAAAVVVLLVGRAGGATPARPLVVGSDAAVVVMPAAGGCNTTFAFIGRGSLSGAGTLVYRWEQSDGQLTADTSLRITPSEGAFQLTQAWRLEGSQTVDGTMTLHILKPVDRRISQSFHYSCP